MLLQIGADMSKVRTPDSATAEVLSASKQANHESHQCATGEAACIFPAYENVQEKPPVQPLLFVCSYNTVCILLA